jgi:hypothetical protein
MSSLLLHPSCPNQWRAGFANEPDGRGLPPTDGTGLARSPSLDVRSPDGPRVGLLHALDGRASPPPSLAPATPPLLACLSAVTLLTGPSSTCAALLAKLRDERVSCVEMASGDRLQTSITLLLPHKLSWSTWEGKRRGCCLKSSWVCRCRNPAAARQKAWKQVCKALIGPNMMFS